MSDAWSAMPTKGHGSKFAVFWLYLLVCAAVLLGLHVLFDVTGVVSTVAIVAVAAVTWVAFRPVFRFVHDDGSRESP